MPSGFGWQSCKAGSRRSRHAQSLEPGAGRQPDVRREWITKAYGPGRSAPVAAEPSLPSGTGHRRIRRRARGAVPGLRDGLAASAFSEHGHATASAPVHGRATRLAKRHARQGARPSAGHQHARAVRVRRRADALASDGQHVRRAEHARHPHQLQRQCLAAVRALERVHHNVPDDEQLLSRELLSADMADRRGVRLVHDFGEQLDVRLRYLGEPR